MKDICNGLPSWGHFLVLAAWLIWDFIMGETRYGSAIRLFSKSIALILERFKQEKEK
jgi:hypothetical protein